MLLRKDRAMTAVAIVMDVAFHAGHGAVVSAAEIAERLTQARRGIEPVLQSLVRAGLLDSLRGPRGGYRLGRPRRDLRLSEIVAAVTDDEAEPGSPAGRLQATVLTPLWADMEALCHEHLQGLTIEDLVKRASAAGLQRPAAAAVTYVI